MSINSVYLDTTTVSDVLEVLNDLSAEQNLRYEVIMVGKTDKPFRLVAVDVDNTIHRNYPGDASYIYNILSKLLYEVIYESLMKEVLNGNREFSSALAEIANRARNIFDKFGL